MRQAPRHLAPGGGPLRLNQGGDVVEHDHIAAAARSRQHRTAHQQHALFQSQLLLPGVRVVLLEPGDDGARQRLQPRPFGKDMALQIVERFLQDGAGAVIHGAQAQVLVEDQHAGRQVGEDILQICLGRFEFGAVRFGHPARVVQLLCHAVERLRKYAQFIAARYLGAAAVVAARHRLGAGGEQRQGFG